MRGGGGGGGWNKVSSRRLPCVRANRRQVGGVNSYCTRLAFSIADTKPFEVYHSKGNGAGPTGGMARHGGHHTHGHRRR